MSFLQKRIGSTTGSFGASLQEMRELRGYSLEQLGKLSGIHPHILRLLEEDRIDELSDPAYDERHVLALAKSLETSPAYFIEKYRALLEEKGITKTHALFPGARVGVFDLFVRARAVAFAGFAVVVLIVAGYVIFAAKNLTSTPHLSLAAPNEGMILSSPSLHISGTTDAGAFVFINGSAVVVDASGAFGVDLDVPRGVSVVHVESKRRYGPSAVIDRHVTYAVDATAIDLDRLLHPATSTLDFVTSTSTTSTLAIPAAPTSTKRLIIPKKKPSLPVTTSTRP